MDLGLTEAQAILKTTAADFVQREYPKETCIELEKSPTGTTPAGFRKVAELGWLGVIIPEEYGGEGRPLTDAAVLFEELGRGPGPVTVAVVVPPGFSSRLNGRRFRSAMICGVMSKLPCQTTAFTPVPCAVVEAGKP